MLINLSQKKLAREFDEDSIDEIVNEVQHLMYNKSKEKQSDDSYFQWSVGGKYGYLSTHYALNVGNINVIRLHLCYTEEYSEIKNSDDKYDYCDEYLTLNSFSLSVKTADNESVIVESEDLGVTKETYKYLFKRYIRRNMKCMTKETSERRFGKFKTR